MVSLLALDENLCPSCQVPVLAISANNLPLLPRPLDVDVQNGITVFPVKSLSKIKLFTGQSVTNLYIIIYVNRSMIIIVLFSSHVISDNLTRFINYFKVMVIAVASFFYFKLKL